MRNKATVIGAGLGGLAAASLLAHKGYNVTVYEKNDSPGGKMQQVTSDGYRFDTGPSLFTMPFMVKDLFNKCGEIFEDYIDLTEPSPLCRYFYNDGVIFDNYSSREKTIEEINRFAPQDSQAYSSFLNRSEELYKKTSDAFLFNPLYNFTDLKGLNIKDFFRINAFSTVSDSVDKHFTSEYLRNFFKRFTTYNGSSPYQAPATLNVIPHVELNQGGYYVKGGLYNIAKALHDLAVKSGVTFHFNRGVESINIEDKRVKSIRLSNGEITETDLLFSNADATDFMTNLLPDSEIPALRKKRQKSLEPSCSGFVMLLGCSKKWKVLKHHNIFFSNDYKKEFMDIFERKIMPDDPTIYIANTSFANPEDAPAGGSNLFILVNSPYISDNQDWGKTKKTYSQFLIDELDKRGLSGIQEAIEFKKVITPEDFLERFGSYKGSIYGTSSNNRLSAFLRPRNKLRGFENIYLVGGSTHPGGGIPLVIQSAFNAVEILDRN